MFTLNRIARLSLLFKSMNIACAHAGEISADYIRGEGDVEGIKLAYRFDILKTYDFDPRIKVYAESSVNFWKYGTPEHYDSNFVVSISPVLQYTFCECMEGELYGEVGIGLSLLDDTEFAGKDVSTHYQFEDRLGVGYRFGEAREYSIALRYFHYSNAGFKKPNPGLDFISFSFSKAY